MKLVEVRLKNFRCFQGETLVPVGDLTALIGRNDSGKSTIMEALEIFFEEGKIDPDDANIHGDSKDVCVTCVFDELPEEVVIDSDYPTSLAQEHLLNPSGRLQVLKRYNCSLKTPKVSGVYLFANYPTTEGGEDLYQLKKTDLQKRLDKLEANKDGINLSVNPQMRKRIWDTLGDLQCKEREIQIDKDEGKKYWDLLKRHMPTFALFRSDRQSSDQDGEVQDPLKAAVKQALAGIQTKLKEVEDSVRKEVMATARATVDKLREMNPKLAQKLNPTFSDPKWDSLFKVSLTDHDEIPINKRGSGVRRLILLNFFRAEAERKQQEAGTTGVIYAFEEPETSQHPNHQKMLLEAFQELAEAPGCQVLLSTHTPMLAGFLPLDSLRYVEVLDDDGRHIHCGDEETAKRVAQALGVLPDNRVAIIVCVEGGNDISFLRGMSTMLNGEDDTLPNLGQMEDDGTLLFIPMGGSNLRLWTNRLAGLYRPEFHIYDRDDGEKETQHTAAAEQVNSRGDRSVAVLTKMREMENYLHPDAIKNGLGLSVEVAFGGEDDVPALVARKVHEADSEKSWDDLDDTEKKEKERKAKKRLNNAAVAAMTPELLAKSDPDGEVKGWLVRIREMAGT